MNENTPEDLLRHRWDVTPEEAVALQKELASKVSLVNGFDPEAVRTVAGIDLSYPGDIGKVAIVVLTYPELALVEYVLHTGQATFPYVPGLLSFRESPLALEALEKLAAKPDLLMLDGQGYAHPRRFGIACHIGLLTGIPAIGVAKTRLTGTHDEPGNNKGDIAPLINKKEQIGAVLRSKPNTNPLYISAGHKIDLETSLRFVVGCLRGYRLPETTRAAHLAAGGNDLTSYTRAA